MEVYGRNSSTARVRALAFEMFCFFQTNYSHSLIFHSVEINYTSKRRDFCQDSGNETLICVAFTVFRQFGPDQEEVHTSPIEIQ